MKFLLDTDTCVYWLRGHPPYDATPKAPKSPIHGA